jgi:ABC-2 type transport system permease protein
MIAQLKKELNVYFSGILGYLIIGIYLLINGLLLWVFEGNPYNILDGGIATLEKYFGLAPWLFLFLIPAVSMRVFSDEIKSGMMELLIVRPLTIAQLIWVKFLATFFVVILAILPTFVYMWSLSSLGSPAGNLDWGATMGSYFGLFAMGAAYTAIALLASSLTSNNVVAFILGVAFNFWMYVGFEYLADLYRFFGLELTISSLGMNEHFTSMARGVLDLRDLGYFIALVIIFVGLTYGIVARNHVKHSWKRSLIWIVIGVIIGFGVQAKRIRWDLTEEKRYSLSEGTENLINRVEEPLLIKVYLEGLLPSEPERLKIETRYMLEEWSNLNDNIYFEFIDPNTVDNTEDFKYFLKERGIKPATWKVDKGNSETKLTAYPGAIMSYQEREEVAVLLEVDDSGKKQSSESAIQQLEFKLAQALNKLLITDKPRIGFTTGHGELSWLETFGIGMALTEKYEVGRFSLNEYKADANGEADVSDMVRRMNTHDLLIVAKPTKPFPELDKYLMDQYLMGGGKILWFIDGVHAEMDSLSFGPDLLAYPTIYDLNLTDLLFRYGVRINGDVVIDDRCAQISDRRDTLPWVYFPLWGASQHPAVANINSIKGEFSSTLDTVEAAGIKKSPLLLSSTNSVAVPAPHTVSLEMLYNRPDPSSYRPNSSISGILLEGEFESAYANRLAPKKGIGLPQIKQSSQTSMAVFSDGDFIRNQLNVVNPNLEFKEPLPLGYDQYLNVQYGNDDLVLNLVDYMVRDFGLMETRTRDVKLRLLDNKSIDEKAWIWKFRNLVLPEFILGLAALIFILLRKRRYA